MSNVTLAGLIGIFAGKYVSITHTNSNFKTIEGVCRTFHLVSQSDKYFDIELEGEVIVGFRPEIVTSDSIQGTIGSCGNCIRKIQIVNQKSQNRS